MRVYAGQKQPAWTGPLNHVDLETGKVSRVNKEYDFGHFLPRKTVPGKLWPHRKHETVLSAPGRYGALSPSRRIDGICYL